VEGAYDRVTEEVLRSRFFFQYLEESTESVMGVGNTILFALMQRALEGQVRNVEQKVFQGEEKAQCQDEESRMDNAQDGNTKEEISS
jgi:hypothetical protein